MKYTKSTSRWMFICLVALIGVGLFISARADGNTTLVPIGASYNEDTLAFFAAQAAARNTDNSVEIRVLPITYASDPFNISASERAANLSQANMRSDQVEDACELVVTSPVTCNSQVVDIQVNSDAQNPALVNQIDASTDGVFILGGDQTIAMLVTANTLLEDALEDLYLDGLPIGGTSAGAAVQSRYMIAGYTGNNFAYDALKLGAIELWYGTIGSSQRGLRFAFEDGVIDQHILERGRILRLLQAAEQHPTSHLGLGVDWGTGVVIQNETSILETVGAYAAIVLDQETYGAAAGADYTGAEDILSIRNVGFHVLPPGPYGYNIPDRQPLVNGLPQPAPSLANRNYGLSLAPGGAGAFYLAGDLATEPLGAVTQDFAALAQSTGLPTVVFSVGYSSNKSASQAANTWASRLSQLGVPNVQTAVLTSNADLNALAAQLSNAGAIFTIGGDQVTMSSQVPDLQSAGIDQILLQRWHAGAHLLFDNAAAAAVGSWMSAEPIPADVEIEASDSFLAGHISITPGLNLLPNLVVEPRFFYDYLYGRLVSHALAHPQAIGYGIERATAVKITPSEISVLGKMAVMTVDPRQATHLGVGTNNAIAAAWLILDTFPTGELIPTVGAPPTATPTASLPTPTPTGPTSTPTNTPIPTSTPEMGALHIAQIQMTVVADGAGRYHAEAQVTVHDENNQPASGAAVFGTFTGDSTNAVNGLTNANGEVTLSSSSVRSGSDWTFCVDDVTKSGYVYNPAANVETCDSTGNPPPATATPTAGPTPTPTVTPAPGGTLHVGDLDNASTSNPTSWNAIVVITIHDQQENPIAGALVSGEWSNGTTGTGSCTTDLNGQCALTRANVRNSVASVTFTVTNVAHSSFTYAPENNHDPDGDSDGTVIVLSAP